MMLPAPLNNFKDNHLACSVCEKLAQGRILESYYFIMTTNDSIFLPIKYNLVPFNEWVKQLSDYDLYKILEKSWLADIANSYKRRM